MTKSMIFLLAILCMIPALKAMEPETGDITGGGGNLETTRIRPGLQRFKKFPKLPAELKWKIIEDLIPEAPIETKEQLVAILRNLTNFARANKENYELLSNEQIIRSLKKRILSRILTKEPAQAFKDVKMDNILPTSLAAQLYAIKNDLDSFTKASIAGNVADINEGLSKGINPNYDDILRNAAMHLNNEVVQILLDHHADINKFNDTTFTILHDVTDMSTVPELEKVGGVWTTNIQQQRRWLDMAQYLLKHGADPTIDYGANAQDVVQAISVYDFDTLNEIPRRKLNWTH